MAKAPPVRPQDRRTAEALAAAVVDAISGEATAEAVQGLVERVRRVGFENVSGGTLANLAALLASRAGLAAAEAFVDEIDALPPAGPRLILRRVEGRFQRRRLAGRRAIGMGHVPPVPVSDHRALLDGIVPADASEPSVALFGECLALLDAVVARHPSSHLDPLHDAADALAVAVRLADAIDARRPTSLVRLGDGEARLLPWRADLELWRAADLIHIQQTWWGGAELSAEAWTALGRELVDAIRAADVVGVSDGVHLGRALLRGAGKPGAGKDLESALDGETRGRLVVLHHAAGLLAAPDGRPLLDPRQMLTSAHIHQALAWWELWQPVIGRAGTVDLVTCHPGLADAVATRFGVSVGTIHRVPGERRSAGQFEQDEARPHFPDTFEALRPALAATPRGRVVLVAAGMLGKIYCAWVKAAGGIALDVGAAADYWLGYNTRGRSAVVDYGLTAGTGEGWHRLAARDGAIARLMGRMAAGSP